MPDSEEAYRTLERNLRDSDFAPGDSSFQWRREVEGLDVVVEFLCETDEVKRGRIHRPKEGHGAKLGALNVEGAELAARDFTTVRVEAERLDQGGMSRVEVQVANLLPYVVLKIQSFQDRHERKDAYDLCFTIRNWPHGPEAAGRVAASSPIASEELVLAPSSCSGSDSSQTIRMVPGRMQSSWGAARTSELSCDLRP